MAVTSTLEQNILRHCKISFYLVGDDFWALYLCVEYTSECGTMDLVVGKRLRNYLNEGKQKETEL